MISDRVISDQLYDWSAKLENKDHDRLAAQTHPTATPATSAQGDPARVVDREVQEMWEVGVQMRSGPRPRPEILSLRQPTWDTSSDGVRSAEISGGSYRIRSQLPQDTGNSRPDRRDQLGASATTREAGLNDHGARHPNRRHGYRRADRKHGSGPSRIRAVSSFGCERSSNAIRGGAHRVPARCEDDQGHIGRLRQ